MQFEQLLQPREAEHLTAGVMRLHQAIAVEEEALSRGEGGFLLLVARARHQPKRHTRRPQFGDTPTVLAIGRLVSCIGVAHPPPSQLQHPTEPGPQPPTHSLDTYPGIT